MTTADITVDGAEEREPAVLLAAECASNVRPAAHAGVDALR